MLADALVVQELWDSLSCAQFQYAVPPAPAIRLLLSGRELSPRSRLTQPSPVQLDAPHRNFDIYINLWRG